MKLRGKYRSGKDYKKGRYSPRTGPHCCCNHAKNHCCASGRKKNMRAAIKTKAA